MLKYWLPNVTGSNGPRADQVVKVVGEVGGFDADAIVRKPLFDADVESARPLGLEIGIAQVARRRVIRLPERRLLDAAADAAAKPRGPKPAVPGLNQPRRRHAGRRIETEAAVVLEADAAHDARVVARLSYCTVVPVLLRVGR